MSKCVFFAILFLAIHYISVVSCMSTNPRWLSVLVMQKYKEHVKTQQDNKAGFVSYVGNLWQENFNHNVKLQTLLKELETIADEVAWPESKNLFEKHRVEDKLFELDLKRDDTVTFLTDLISCFEKAYANNDYQRESLKNMHGQITETEKRYRQDTANSLIYHFVCTICTTSNKSCTDSCTESCTKSYWQC